MCECECEFVCTSWRLAEVGDTDELARLVSQSVANLGPQLVRATAKPRVRRPTKRAHETSLGVSAAWSKASASCWRQAWKNGTRRRVIASRSVGAVNCLLADNLPAGQYLLASLELNSSDKNHLSSACKPQPQTRDSRLSRL